MVLIYIYIFTLYPNCSPPQAPNPKPKNFFLGGLCSHGKASKQKDTRDVRTLGCKVEAGMTSNRVPEPSRLGLRNPDIVLNRELLISLPNHPYIVLNRQPLMLFPNQPDTCTCRLLLSVPRSLFAIIEAPALYHARVRAEWETK